MHNEKGQQVDESNSNGLYQKICSGQLGHFVPEMAHPDNSGSALRIVLKLCRMKGANRYMKILLFFKMKFDLGQFDLFNL